MESTGTSDDAVAEVTDTTPTFSEAKDKFGNALTETTFTDGEFGTIYRSFKFNEDTNSDELTDDSGNNLIEETDALGHKTTYTVDGDTSRNEEVTDRLGNKTAYEYDDSGRTTKVTSKKADGTELAHVSYAYDTFDNMTEIVRGDGMKYALAYNEFHNLESIGIEGKTEKLIQYTYKNGNGRLKEMKYANGDTMKATYNSIGQMVAETWFDKNGVETARYKYVYDGDGNIVRSIDIFAKKEYNYQYEEGRIVRATEADIELSGEIVTSKVIVNTVKYYYDTEGKMTKKVITPASGTAQTIYYETNDDNTVVKFSAGGRTVTSHSKSDHLGRKVFDELQLGSGLMNRKFSYHEGVISQNHLDNGKQVSDPQTTLVKQIEFADGRIIEYEYDAEERITRVIDTVDGTYEYVYDEQGQLLTEMRNGDTVSRMTYDDYGNIINKNGVAYTYGGDDWKDQLTRYGSQTIGSYDGNGNPRSYLGKTLVWEKGRQLKSFGSTTYTYNKDGIRTSKTVNGVKHSYVLDGTNIVKETWGSNTLIPLYDLDNSVCGIKYNNTAYYFYKNLQGDVIAITDASGTVIARYVYDAWGRVLQVTDAHCNSVANDSAHIANINPFRYRGYYYDTETQLYYLQSRYYDPKVGRFINADDVQCLGANTTVIGYDLFSYCCNSPVNDCDQVGYFSWWVATSFLNGIIAGIKSIVDWIKNIVSNVLRFYTSLSWKDISAIAKDIGRSPHRVKQALGSLVNKLVKVKSVIGKIAIGIAILSLVSSLGEKVVRLGNVAKIIAECVVEAAIALVEWALTESLRTLLNLLPVVGFILGWFAGAIVSFFSSFFIDQRNVAAIKQRVTARIELATYDLYDYFATFFTCLA